MLIKVGGLSMCALFCFRSTDIDLFAFQSTALCREASSKHFLIQKIVMFLEQGIATQSNSSFFFIKFTFKAKDEFTQYSSDGDQTPFEVPIFILCAIYDFFASYSSFKDCPLQLLCLLQEVFNVTDPVVKWAQTTLGKHVIPPLNIINTTTITNIDA